MSVSIVCSSLWKTRALLVESTHLLLRLHLRDSIDIMLMPDLHHPLPQRDHPRLDAHSLKLRPAELVRTPRQLGPVDRVIHRHLPAVDLQDLRPGFLVGQRKFDLAVQAAGPQQGRVEYVDAVGGGEDLDAVVGGEAVELVEQF